MAMRGLQDQQGNTGEIDAMRGRQLQRLGRNDDALTAYREALAQDPDNAQVLRLLAYCQLRSERESEQALLTIDRAIELEPNDPDSHVIRALVLVDRGEVKPALEAADRAIELEPEAAMGYSVLAQAHMKAQAWAAAETAAKMALAIDPDEEMAATVLAHALFCQGKQLENQVHIGGMLHRDPEDPYTHHAAGLAALQAEEFAKAEEHFLEALRLDPEFEPARDGLLDAFRARSVIYRGYLRYAFFVTRLSPRQRLGFFFGVLILAQVAFRSTAGVLPALTLVLIGVYLLFVVWTHVAGAVGSLIVLGDRSARHALRTRERVKAVAAGGGVVLGGLVLGLGLMVNALSLAAVGVGFFGMAIPLILFLDHSGEPRRGRVLYGGLAALGFAALLGILSHLLWPGIGAPILSASMRVMLGVLIVATWCAALSVWRD